MKYGDLVVKTIQDDYYQNVTPHWNSLSEATLMQGQICGHIL